MPFVVVELDTKHFIIARQKIGGEDYRVLCRTTSEANAREIVEKMNSVFASTKASVVIDVAKIRKSRRAT